MEEVRHLSPSAFEYFSKYLLKEFGYSDVQVSPKYGTFHADGGIDLYARHNGNFVVGQCKSWTKGRAGYMPIEQVRALGGSMKEKHAPEGVFVSTLPFGKQSRIYAMSVGMTLIGPSEIAATMRRVNPAFKARSSFFRWFIEALELRQLFRKEIMPRVYALIVLVILLIALPHVWPWIMRIIMRIQEILQ